ncbi:related to MFS monocarboxylate transporter [Rhynchosporium secalis]|uniref:Related to MFS monocarboxylate transporter n=1 Tax=Rhynchosporium secalis TaxID=38038 RepID=A0A1E1M7L5_RHYSE|nr:related to MFS monocarboxylate transporter [Rhynchosporium secalis]
MRISLVIYQDVGTKSTLSTSSPTAPPDGGTVAWLFVFAAFPLLFTTWGPSMSAGVFQDFYQRKLLAGYSPSVISWIGTVNSAFLISTGVLAGPLFDRGFVRHLMVLGSIMVVFGQMMLSLSTSYYQIMLSQGFCVGIGAGLIYVPAIAMVNTQFAIKRALAMGIVTSGASLALPFLFLGKPVPKPKNVRSIIHWHALKEYTFCSYRVGNFLIFMGYFIPLFYVPSFALGYLGTSQELGFGLLAALNGASLFGRIGSALLSPRFGVSRSLLGAVVVSSIACFVWMGINSLAGFVAFCLLFGFFSGVLISANPIVVAHPVISPTSSVIGTRLGMQWFATSLGVLVGAPIAGALGDAGTRDSFMKLQGLSGAMMLGGAILLMVPLMAFWKHDRKGRA